MLTQQWVAPGDALHTLFPTTGTKLVTAYTVLRPDGTYSVMFVNKDRRAHDVTVDIRTGAGTRHFAGMLTRAIFGPQQYRWHDRGAKSLPDPDLPPSVTSVTAAPSYVVPGDAIVVLRGRVQ